MYDNDPAAPLNIINDSQGTAAAGLQSAPLRWLPPARRARHLAVWIGCVLLRRDQCAERQPGRGRQEDERFDEAFLRCAWGLTL